MPTGFPPQIAFPLGLDSDKTLYLVYNTSEAKTTSENSAWQEDVEITPVDDCDPEIWADNGFANISGEMFYYDAVEKNSPAGSGAVFGNVRVDSKGAILSVSVVSGGSGYCYPELAVRGTGTGAKLKAVVSETGSITRVDVLRPGIGYEEGSTVLELQGKVFKFKRCLRNMGGKPTKFNPSGTWVRGFVMAEHHNQIVDATIAVEKYIFDLEDRVSKLENEPVCSDDAYCAEVTLETRLIQDPEGCRETTMQYDVIVNGVFNTFTLDFGDGQSTSSVQSGTHTYASGANIDPVVTVFGDECTVVQTPISRTRGSVPEVPETPTFVIPIPQVPNFPEITIPDFQQPNPQVELPQIVFPCLNVSPISTDINIPSIINIVPPVISFIPPNISPVTFTFGPAPTISPASFTFGPAPSISPASFTFGPPPTISPASFTFGPAPKISPASFTFGPAPKISPASFTFGSAPKISPASFTFGPAPKISPASFIWGTPPKITGASFVWGTPPKVSPASFIWGTAPKITGASFVWGTPPKISPASFVWGTAPKVSPASFIWGTPPKITSSFNWGETPSVTGSFTWGDYVPSVTGSFEWGEIPSVTGSFEWGPAPSVTGYFDWGPTPSVTGSFNWGPTPSITASLEWSDPPKISIEWGSVPTLSCVVTVECGGSGSTPFRRANTLDENFVDDFNTDNFDIEISDIGIPSEIKVVVPKFPDIKISHDIPKFIDIKSDIPNKIVLYQADVIPKEIRIVSESVIPSVISVDSSGVPSSIKIDANSVPGFISLVPVNIPTSIRLDGSEIPESIKVVGIPESIEVKMPSEIVARLQVPENLEIPLVYKGGPVPIQFDTSNLLGGDEQACFALVPCNKK